MAMPVSVRRFTVDEVDAFPPDGNRYEVLDGILLVTPSPGVPHQTVAAQLTILIGGFLAAEAGIQVWAPGVLVQRPWVQLEPDVLVGTRPVGPSRWENVIEHWLAVEVSGVGSQVYDRDYKRDAYLELGVREVWLVDLRASSVFVSRRGGPKDVPHQRDLLWRSPAGRELTLDIGALFRSATDDPGDSTS